MGLYLYLKGGVAMKKIISLFCSLVTALTLTVLAFAVNDSYNVAAAEVYDVPYYYYQLSDNAQKSYDELKEAVLNHQRTIKIRYSINQDDFEQIAELLILHDPTTFNLKSLEAQKVTRSSITFKLNYRYNQESYEKMVEEYEKKVDKILAKLTDDMTTYRKIRVIHDSIINTAVYDIDYKLSDTMYGTLVKKRGKCDGYAKTFAYICEKAGIKAVTVIGTDTYTTDDSMHMWNKVYYKNNWYNVDVTWDDPVSNMKNNRKYEFFMVSDKEFGKTHTEDNLSFDVPKAKDSSKTYFKVYNKHAESLSEAKEMIKTELEKAAKNETTSITFQCSDDETYQKACEYVYDANKICSVLKNVTKNTNSNLIHKIYSYGVDDVHKTIKIYVFYKNKDLDDYYTDTSEVKASTLKTLAEYGIE